MGSDRRPDWLRGGGEEKEEEGGEEKKMEDGGPMVLFLRETYFPVLCLVNLPNSETQQRSSEPFRPHVFFQAPACAESAAATMWTRPATGATSTATPASATRGTATQPTTATWMTSARVNVVNLAS